MLLSVRSRLPPFFAGSRRWALLGIIFTALVQTLLAVVIAFQTRAIFAAFGENHNVPLIPLALLLTCGLFIAVLRVLEQSLGDSVGYSYAKSLRTKLFSHISRLSLDDLQGHRQGSLQIRFVGDLSAIQNWVGKAIPKLISASILLPGLMFLLFWLHPAMALAGLGLASISVACMHFTAPKLKRFHKDVRSRRGNLASFVSARIHLAPMLRIMGLRLSLCQQIEDKSERLRKAAVMKSLMVNSFKRIPEFFLQILSVMCFVLAFYFHLEAADAAVIFAILGIFQQPLRDVADFWDKQNAYLVSRRKCLQLLSTKSITRGQKHRLARAQRKNLEVRTHDLKVFNILYPDLIFPAQSATLICGGQGSGKSSLLKAMVGMLRPQQGSVCWGEIQSTQLAESTCPKLFSYLNEEVPVFSASLRNNLTLGIEQRVRRSDLEKAIDTFGLRELEVRLGGINGRILELGKNLSNSEMLRIACCRAWLSNSMFLLIDDLDVLLAKTNMKVVRSLLEKKNVTVIACSTDHQPWVGQFSKVIDLDTANVMPFPTEHVR